MMEVLKSRIGGKYSLRITVYETQMETWSNIMNRTYITSHYFSLTRTHKLHSTTMASVSHKHHILLRYRSRE
jgi:hypothetical protein